MLQSAKHLHGFKLSATDGEIGKVKDAFFDDQYWALRYLVVDTGNWLPGRRVLISPMSLKGVDWENQSIAVDLSRQQVENSPGINNDKPVSRQYEGEFLGYYGYPMYWGGPYLWGDTAYPGLPGPAVAPNDEVMRGVQKRADIERTSADSHLRSCNEVTGYHLDAADGEIGHVEDFIFDELGWDIRHIAVDTRNWLPGKHVLITPDSIEDVDWRAHKVRVDATRDEIKSKPEYDSSSIGIPGI